jgi:beta-glucosidase
MEDVTFPPEFLWGVSTSAFQIEGAWDRDGKGLSVWDVFSRRRGAVMDGSSAEQAADHYSRWYEDLELVRDLGCRSYRFSISWPRVFPQGYGTVNPRGLDVYDRIVDRLCLLGIEPMVTLYHWDLPQALQEIGGWSSRSILDPFVEYVAAVAQRIGDRVAHWITINEPLSVVGAGYLAGVHAPGVRNPVRAARALHNLLLAHGLAVGTLRQLAPSGKIGIANAFSPVYPMRRQDTRVASWINHALNRLCMDPIMFGHYPVGLSALVRLLNRSIRPGDFDTMSAPFDFVGVNHYSRYIAQRRLFPFLGFRLMPPSNADALFTDLNWEIYPEGFYDMLTWISKTYDNPVMIVTENGAAFADPYSETLVQDDNRIRYLEGYLKALRRAMDSGANVKGYFVWSLLDNFEWAYGLSKRFGLYYVDYPTQRRVPKTSALWFKELCRTGGFCA